MYRFYESPVTLDEALAYKALHGPHARIIAGGTDLLIELHHAGRRAPDGGAPGLIDLTRTPGLAAIDEDATHLHLGPLVTHNQCVASQAVQRYALPLAQACREVGAPQIRNRATIAGNLITASPANDAIAPLMALDATVTVASAARGERTLPLADFITDFRRVDLADDEILTRISIPKTPTNARSVFIKLGLRRAQAISVVSVAAILTQDNDGVITDARIALGAVAPVIVRADAAEAYLRGKMLTETVMDEAARLSLAAAAPIDDIRGSADYRRGMVETLVRRALRRIQMADGQMTDGEEPSAHRPIMLWGESEGVWPVAQTKTLDEMQDETSDAEMTLVNGAPVKLIGDQTLLDSLRAAGFVGVKEGCAEGECGACTIFLDGMAVMACMVPAERAQGSRVTTVEGLGRRDDLHPVQAAFVDAGGVQCGYCTPGFVMSAAKLLEEAPHPTREQAAEAFTGNFCRCTGYRKIIDAVVTVGERGSKPKQE
ncbi:MAG: FAD binding domain-containing protein [Caldilineaceae bacterium]|nr:FAD binding domain-containing protein [Caldilineaceae bacterium]